MGNLLETPKPRPQGRGSLLEGNVENNIEVKKFIVKPRDIIMKENVLGKMIRQLKERIEKQLIEKALLLNKKSIVSNL